MNFLRGIVKWIASLESDDKHFRMLASILLKVLGVLALIATIVWGIAICVSAIDATDHLESGARTLVIIGAILILGINVIIGPVLVILFWNRSNKVSALNEEPMFRSTSYSIPYSIPITVILIRLFGEMVFLILVGIGIQGLVLSIFGTEITTMGVLGSLVNPEQLLSGNTNEIGVLSLVISVISSLYIILLPSHFITGIISLVISVISGIFLLIFHYFIAELINQFIDMVKNINKNETTYSTEANPSDI